MIIIIITIMTLTWRAPARPPAIFQEEGRSLERSRATGLSPGREAPTWERALPPTWLCRRAMSWRRPFRLGAKGRGVRRLEPRTPRQGRWARALAPECARRRPGHKAVACGGAAVEPRAAAAMLPITAAVPTARCKPREAGRRTLVVGPRDRAAHWERCAASLRGTESVGHGAADSAPCSCTRA